jgi:RNA polymerase-binding protein DksA
MEEGAKMPATARFAPSTMDSLIEALHARRAALSHCVDGMLKEADDAVHNRDVSDLLDHEDPASDVDTEAMYVLTEHAEECLREVDDALARVENGTYGFCASCGADIPLQRLRALPTTELCVDCSAHHVV